ncbi:winged helix DNA-binding domain-containing protein [Candidatus Solirubrobacter pratensis]|uniref:winged helix DNA-binding domain-containing protein n=1 Tax=Candidatus Solirubrobacter pratensis TaxID=1298857 RepID=UPI00041F93FA|nr:winged helix DNA-binding domain-containing protein [Candidatus Solirubrobacter pratensis]
MTRTLTQLELNRAVLARQGLLERFDAPLPGVLERIGGIQAQYAPSMYIGLWSRVNDLERDAVTDGLERRGIVQATLMRSTIHLVSKADYWPLALAIRGARRVSWRRATKSTADMDAAAATAREALRGRHLRRAELEQLVGKEAFHGLGLWLDMVRVPPSGTWERRRADLYGLAEEWVGAPGDAGDAHATLVRRYLQGFGPATRNEIANFAGLRVSDLELDGLDLCRFAAEDGAELLDLPGAPLPGADTPAPPSFLPTWDATLLGHARRALIIREEDRPRIFSSKTPQSFPTFLAGGTVAGTWRFADGEVILDPWRPLPAADLRALEEEGEALARYLGGQ